MWYWTYLLLSLQAVFTLWEKSRKDKFFKAKYYILFIKTH